MKKFLTIMKRSAGCTVIHAVSLLAMAALASFLMLNGTLPEKSVNIIAVCICILASVISGKCIMKTKGIAVAEKLISGVAGIVLLYVILHYVFFGENGFHNGWMILLIVLGHLISAAGNKPKRRVKY